MKKRVCIPPLFTPFIRVVAKTVLSTKSLNEIFTTEITEYTELDK